MTLWAIRERVGLLANDGLILHFTIAATRRDAWRTMFHRLNSMRDSPKAQRRAKRNFKAVKVEIREVSE